MEKTISLDQTAGTIKNRVIINNKESNNLVITLTDAASRIRFTASGSSFDKAAGSFSIVPDNYQVELVGAGRAEIRIFSVNVYWYDKGGTQPQVQVFEITSAIETLVFKGFDGALRVSVKSDTTFNVFGDGDKGDFIRGRYKAQIDSIAEGENPYFSISTLKL